ncbi:hypothetical protein E8E11_011931 [Didymella keratinophila]|nr:hypothetical protein E8E11_011931 [Didymella keratinophila]
MIGILITILAGFTLSVFSYPIPVYFASSSTTQEHVPCETVDKYTVDWFEKQAWKRKELDLPLDNALFYTRGMSEMAQKYACDHDLATIWHIWPTELYQHEDKPTNAMRCIHNNTSQRQRFFENMSEAYAKLAKGTVIVMHNASDWTSPPRDGIWYRVEYKTMVNAAEAVTTILKLKEDENGSVKVVWDRELSLTSVLEEPISKVLAIGRHVPSWLGTKLDWVAGSIESTSQAILRTGENANAHRGKTVCEPVVYYPYEIA